MPLRLFEAEDKNSKKKVISIVVVVFNMAREAPRTLFTLTPEYQGVDPELYEVLVLDNGSAPPFGKQVVESMSENFRYVYIDDAPPSPSFALNKGVRLAKGELVGLMIDGARMLSPGVLNYALRAYKAYNHPAIITLGFHIGPKQQQDAVRDGYNQQEENKLLNSVQWQKNGYDLFRISCFANSCKGGWFGKIAESNCIFMKKSDYQKIGGFDESFDLPGGGFVNLDFFQKACTNNRMEPVVILGEGNFHQFHDGSTTGKSRKELKKKSNLLREQYAEIRNKSYEVPSIDFEYLGHLPASVFSIPNSAVQHKKQKTKSSSHKAKIVAFMNQYSVLSSFLNFYRRLQ